MSDFGDGPPQPCAEVPLANPVYGAPLGSASTQPAFAGGKWGVALVIADGEALTLGLIVDLLKVDHKTFVHVEVLPRTVDDYTDRYSHASHRQRACA